MPLFFLTTLTMIAFAANSVLNRLALVGGSIDAASFGAIRLVAGAVMLAGLCLVLRRRIELRGPGRIAGVLALLFYIYGFSGAYNALDAGIGALILFGVVQITMFAGGLWAREAFPPRRWIGAIVAFGGLAWLLWPGADPVISPMHGLLMALAGVGWGIYSLAGRLNRDALQATAANFILAAPVGVAVALLWPSGPDGAEIGRDGILLAIASGALTSGVGYAMWYSILPRIGASVAAVAQLTVPVIAMAGGMIFLAEALDLQFVMATVLVLGGVAISVLPLGRVRRDT